jgi:hypothetical protein
MSSGVGLFQGVFAMTVSSYRETTNRNHKMNFRAGRVTRDTNRRREST